MPTIIINHEHYNDLTFQTKTVSEAWEVARVLMVSNPEITGIEVLKNAE